MATRSFPLACPVGSGVRGRVSSKIAADTDKRSKHAGARQVENVYVHKHWDLKQA